MEDWYQKDCELEVPYNEVPQCYDEGPYEGEGPCNDEGPYEGEGPCNDEGPYKEVSCDVGVPYDVVPWDVQGPLLSECTWQWEVPVAEEGVEEPQVDIACKCISEPQLTKVDIFAEYSYGGKNYAFKDPVGRMCECPICQGVVKRAQSVRCCKKTFCKSCLDEALKKFKRCPLCRTENPMTYENDAIDDGVNDLRVLCLHHRKGCEWSGHLLHEPQHREEKCGYEEVECKNREFGCEVVGERRFMKQHIQEECDYREIPCGFCNELQRVWEIGGHLPACPDHPVECVNGCGAEGLLRKNIASHLEVCPEAVVDCPFKEMGCSEGQLKRKDIQSHTTNAVSDHLALVMKSHVETKQAMREQADAHESETRGLKARIDQLQVDADAQRKKTEGLRVCIEQLQLDPNTCKYRSARQKAICKVRGCNSVATALGHCTTCWWRVTQSQ